MTKNSLAALKNYILFSGDSNMYKQCNKIKENSRRKHKKSFTFK